MNRRLQTRRVDAINYAHSLIFTLNFLKEQCAIYQTLVAHPIVPSFNGDLTIRITGRQE